MANAHQLDHGEQGTNVEDDTVTTGVEDMSPPDDEASHENDASPADLCNVLLTSSKRAADKPHQANTRFTYTVGKCQADKHGALINRGANRGVTGADIFNHEFDEGGEEWYDALTDHTKNPHGEQFDEFGNYCKRQAAVAEDNFVGAVLDGGLTVDSYVWYVNQVDLSKRQPEARHAKPGERDWETLRHFFSWASVESVEKTFQATMQLGRLSNAVHLKEHCHSPNPALNVRHRQEPIATDYVYADVPAVENGSMGAQIFVGMGSEVVEEQGLKSPKQFVHSLEDNIRKCGAIDKLVSDRVQMEIGQHEQDILQALFISSWQSKPHQQQQNLAERKYQTLRRYTNTTLSHTGAPANTWLLCLLYVCFLLNSLACQSLQWRTPLEALEGSTHDISPLLHFSFWDPVYYKFNDSDFPSGSTEGRGHWVGITENVGHAMTYQILTDDTKKVIYRSNVRSALTKEDCNKRVDLLGGEEVAPIINSSNDEDKSPREPMPIFDPTDLVGRTFLMDLQENGEQYRTEILEALVENGEQLAKHPDRIKFICSVSDDKYEEILTYNETLEYIAKNEEQDADQAIMWRFKHIAGHQGPSQEG